VSGVSRGASVRESIRGVVFDVDGTLLLSNRSLGGYELLPGAIEVLSKLKAQQVPALQLGDAAAVVASILAGAHIVRVHDVAAVLPAVRIADAVLAASGGWAGREVGR